jgi:predicted small integral membrane protein
MWTVVLYLMRPAAATRRIQSRPLLWPAFAATCVAGVLLLIMRWPSLSEAVVRHLPTTADAADREWVRDLLARELYFRCAVLPLLLGARIVTISALLFLLCTSTSAITAPRFRWLLVLSAHALFLHTVATVLARIVGWDTFGPASAGVPGIAWFITLPADRVLASLIRSVNIVTLWYVAALAVGLHVLVRGSSLRSFLISVIVWVASVLTNLWMIRMLQESLHLHV